MNIPVPKISIVQDYEHNLSPDFIVTQSYVRPAKPASEELIPLILFTADLEDEQFVEQQQKSSNASDYGDKDVDSNIDNNNGDETSNVGVNNSSLSGTVFDGGIRPQLTISLFEQMIDIMENATAFDTIIRLDQAEKLFAAKLSLPKSPMVAKVYNYWVSKRCKLRKPLLRKYWPVTAINDTNPHMVFRPREKEKYTLRKKRKNDMDAFRKMQLLRKDFERVRMLLDMVRRREKLSRSIVDIRQELFEQHMYDCFNTSGFPRSTRLDLNELEGLLRLPNNGAYSLDSSSLASMGCQKKGKRKRDGTLEDSSIFFSAPSIVTNEGTYSSGQFDQQTPSSGVPLFAQPLPSREKMVTSWENATPYVANYVEGRASSVSEFRHRGRIGRGGRLCIDRLPCAINMHLPTRYTHYVGGAPPYASLKPAHTLLDLMPPPLDYKATRMKIAEICAQWSDDEDDAELVKVTDWINTDEQTWGEEKLTIGPL